MEYLYAMKNMFAVLDFTINKNISIFFELVITYMLKEFLQIVFFP
jgi:hypothetical protein